jgi:cell division septal protein FtsQ
MKQAVFVSLFLKIVLITSLFVGVFQVWMYIFPEVEDSKIPVSVNTEIYQSAYSASL